MTARAALLLLLAGCSLPQRHASLLEAGTTQAIVYPADLRGAYVIGTRFCAEPAPDIALASTEKLTGALKLLSETGQSLEANAAADLASSVAELSGRTSLVLLARELLYRGCELSLNAPGQDPAAALAIYNRVADLVEALGKADEKRAEADAARQRRLEANGARIDAILGAP